MSTKRQPFTDVVLWCRSPRDGVLPAFPVDTNSPHDTAIQWAEGYHGNMPACYTYPNLFHHVELKTLEVREEGGRAYKVHVHHDDKVFLVDFREYALLDTILSAGIQAGGRLNGSYLFIHRGSHTTLVRRGSYLEQESEEQRLRANQDKISLTSLIPGHIYQGKNRDHAYLYLGTAMVPEFRPRAYKGSYTKSEVSYSTLVRKHRLFLSQGIGYRETLGTLAWEPWRPRPGNSGSGYYFGIQLECIPSPSLYNDCGPGPYLGTLDPVGMAHEWAEDVRPHILPVQDRYNSLLPHFRCLYPGPDTVIRYARAATAAETPTEALNALAVVVATTDLSLFIKSP